MLVVLTVIKRKRTVRAAIWKPDQANTGTPRSASFEDDVPTSKRMVMGKEESRRYVIVLTMCTVQDKKVAGLCP